MAFIPEVIGKEGTLQLEMEYRHLLLKEGIGVYAAYGEYINYKFANYFINLYLHFDRKSPSQEMVFGRLHLSFNTPNYFTVNVIRYTLSEAPLDSRILAGFESNRGSSLFIIDVATKHILKTVEMGEQVTMQLAFQATNLRVYPTFEAFEKHGHYKKDMLGLMISKAFEDYYNPNAFKVAKTEALVALAKDSTAKTMIVGEVLYQEKIWHRDKDKQSYLATHVVVKTDFGPISVIFHKTDNVISDIFSGYIIEAEGYLTGDIAVGIFSGGSYSDA